jgi:DNA processing protein
MYPPQLRHIANPPAVLYYKGDIRCISGKRTVTAVGTRNASDYSLRTASYICGELARYGVTIISGFAVGTDITAQLAAADLGRPSACVLGCGVDVDYPRVNFPYRDHILETGGVFISEYPPGTPPHSQHFPFRNRILAALGRVTIVFEASLKSGSLITANLSLDQGREVFCLPPADIMSESYSGNCHLLQTGASPLMEPQDVLDCFRIGGSSDSEIRTESAGIMSKFGFVPDDEDKLRVRREMLARANVSKGIGDISGVVVTPVRRAKKLSAPEKNVPDLSGLTETQKSIAELLMDGAVHADVIAQKLDMDAGELMTELTELEILGIIDSLPGKMFEISR